MSNKRDRTLKCLFLSRLWKDCHHRYDAKDEISFFHIDLLFIVQSEHIVILTRHLTFILIEYRLIVNTSQGFFSDMGQERQFVSHQKRPAVAALGRSHL